MPLEIACIEVRRSSPRNLEMYVSMKQAMKRVLHFCERYRSKSILENDDLHNNLHLWCLDSKGLRAVKYKTKCGG